MSPQMLILLKSRPKKGRLLGQGRNLQKNNGFIGGRFQNGVPKVCTHPKKIMSPRRTNVGNSKDSSRRSHANPSAH
jgi:hypothetical protein